MEIREIIDITAIEPCLRPAIILKKFDELNPGESFIILNDHDPKTLYYHLLAERGVKLNWEYINIGPTQWKVKTGKQNLQNSTETIGDIVSKNYNTAQVFKNLNIDFYCEGERTLRDVCLQNGLNQHSVELELTNTQNLGNTPTMNFLTWDLSFLCKYLVQLHHQYIKTYTDFINELTEKVAKTNGFKYPEILIVAETFQAASKLITNNTQQQEDSVFPYLTKLSEAHKTGRKLTISDFGPLSAITTTITAEHHKIGSLFKQISQSTQNYQLPAYPSNTHIMLFKMLRDYQDDLHFHLHLENNILFPKALKLENEMYSKNMIQ